MDGDRLSAERFPLRSFALFLHGTVFLVDEPCLPPSRNGFDAPWDPGLVMDRMDCVCRRVGPVLFPRPFMVEHGIQDGIAPREWVEYEYAKVKNYYVSMGKGDLTDIDLHHGGHIINGVKSYPFLHKHLD